MENRPMENLVLSSHDVISSISSSAPDNISITTNENDNDSPQEGSSGGENDHGISLFSLNASPQSSQQLLKKENKDNSPKDDKNQKDCSLKSHTNGTNFTQSQESTKCLSNTVELRKHSSDHKKDSKGRHRKKKSWYSNILYPTYKSRSDNFKKIFKDVPDDERLVVDYSCALQREILLHGRLYITQNYLGFYANIFTWETLVTLRWRDVTSITKEKTALVIPNAISIHTANEKFFFTSFGSRDKTFMMLFKVWQNALMGKPMSVSEMWQLVHDSYGKELGLTSDDEDYVASLSTLTTGEKSPDKRTSLDSILEGHKDDDDDTTPLKEIGRIGFALTESISPVHSVIGVLPEDLSDLSDSSESEIDKASSTNSQNASTSAICTSPHDGRMMIKATFPIDVNQLFTLLFTTSKFFLDFHTARKSTDLVQSDWTQDITTGQKVRKVSLTVFLNKSVGPKSSQVTETQIMLPCSTPGQIYCIDVETVNAGIPYADSFSVATHYCISRVSKNESSLVVYSDIKYKKNVWGLVKTIIDKSFWTGVQEYLNSLVKALNIECEENCEIFVKGRKRKSRRQRISSVGLLQNHSPDHTAYSYQPSISELPVNPRINGRLIPDQRKEENSTLSWIILIAVICLIIINCLLYYKLSNLEEANMYTKIDLHVLKTTPKTEEDWINLLQQQESLHTVEVKKWQRVLHTTIQLLKQTEESLTQLQMSIHPTMSEKVISVLKPGIKISQGEQRREL
ncbi:GRAM domain-containing protein 1B-like [Copidosoma floridanum]|uniref:GRAM domain-containing protein 1B-like n=1 Tax=Copidosoma floridanum TaxID=29053 RepID=UPI000C6FAC09|nr:GRAM domain-containing protein 1B-like [Copidosoma floridanum]